MKKDLGGVLTKDRGGIGGPLDYLVHVGREPRGSMGPLPPPRWR